MKRIGESKETDQVGRPALKVSGLQFEFPDVLELEARFEVGEGERLALVGPSGSGKSTLLRLLAGLLPLKSGSVSLGGIDLVRVPVEKRGCGMVFQDGALFPALSVIENVAYGLRVRGVPFQERTERALAGLKRVGLENRAQSSIGGLSGGERQRVAFLRALIWEPKYLLLDEPFSALDGMTRGAVQEVLLDLHRDCPVPLILVTHDEQDLQKLATRRVEARTFSDSFASRKIRFFQD